MIALKSEAFFDNGSFRLVIEDEGGKIAVNTSRHPAAPTTPRSAISSCGCSPDPPSAWISARPKSSSMRSRTGSIADDEVTGAGAEGAYYAGLQRPYTAKNAPLDCIEELLMVKGVTRELFYGTGESPGLAQCLTVFGDAKDQHQHRPEAGAPGAGGGDDGRRGRPARQVPPGARRTIWPIPPGIRRSPGRPAITDPHGADQRPERYLPDHGGRSPGTDDRADHGGRQTGNGSAEGQIVVLEGGMMPERILGLDIGASSVKAVLLSRGFRGGYRLLGFRLIDLAAAGGLPEALEQLFADQTFRGAVCVTTLPSGAALLPERPASLPRRPEDPSDPRLCRRAADPDAPRRGLHRLHADRPDGRVGDLRRPRPPRARR